MAEAIYKAVDNLDRMAELAPNYNRFLTRLVEKYLPGEKKLVDFGAGTGTFADMLRARGLTVVCMEPDAAMNAQLQARGLEAHASIESLPESDAPAIFTFNVLEHIEDDVAALRSIFRRLRPGGRLLVYVPAFQIIFSSMDRKVGHHRRYTRGMLCARLRQAGFRIESARYADSLGFAASLAFKWFGNDRGDLNPAGLRVFDRWVFPLSRALDLVARFIVGKNAIVLARRPQESA
jgi:SAM-dependent methyltransferase